MLCEDKSSAIVRNEMKCHMVTVIGSHNIPCTNGKDRYREQDYYVHSKIVGNWGHGFWKYETKYIQSIVLKADWNISLKTH